MRYFLVTKNIKPKQQTHPITMTMIKPRLLSGSTFFGMVGFEHDIEAKSFSGDGVVTKHFEEAPTWLRQKAS